MPDRSLLLRNADDLRQQADHEPDATIRDRLLRMAEHCVQLAAAEDWSATHPTSAASVGDLFAKDE